LKYLDYKKCVDLNAYVKVFYAIIRKNGETFKEYIINVFSYTLKEMASNWCHNYMSKFLACTFLSSHKGFINVIGRLRMMNIFTWGSRISSRERLSESRCNMNTYRNWLMDYKHQPHIVF
jgi:hypothetical protein